MTRPQVEDFDLAARAPVTQRVSPDVQSLAVVTHRLDHHMHVWMGFVGVQHHCVAVLRAKLLPSEVLHGRQELLGRRPCRH